MHQIHSQIQYHCQLNVSVEDDIKELYREFGIVLENRSTPLVLTIAYLCFMRKYKSNLNRYVFISA